MVPKVYKNGAGICFTGTLPDNIISQGIKEVILKAKPRPKGVIYWEVLTTKPLEDREFQCWYMLIHTKPNSAHMANIVKDCL